MGSKLIVEVVQCKECKYFKHLTDVGDIMAGHCVMMNDSFVFGIDFCSYGKESVGEIYVEDLDLGTNPMMYVGSEPVRY